MAEEAAKKKRVEKGKGKQVAGAKRRSEEPESEGRKKAKAEPAVVPTVPYETRCVACAHTDSACMQTKQKKGTSCYHCHTKKKRCTWDESKPGQRGVGAKKKKAGAAPEPESEKKATTPVVGPMGPPDLAADTRASRLLLQSILNQLREVRTMGEDVLYELRRSNELSVQLLEAHGWSPDASLVGEEEEQAAELALRVGDRKDLRKPEMVDELRRARKQRLSRERRKLREKWEVARELREMEEGERDAAEESEEGSEGEPEAGPSGRADEDEEMEVEDVEKEKEVEKEKDVEERMEE